MSPMNSIHTTLIELDAHGTLIIKPEILPQVKRIRLQLGEDTYVHVPIEELTAPWKGPWKGEKRVPRPHLSGRETFWGGLLMWVIFAAFLSWLWSSK